MERLVGESIVLGILGVVLCAVATAQTARSGAAVLEPIGDFDLIVDGRPDPEARLYQSQDRTAVLVASTRLPTPVLIHPGSGGVQAVPLMRLAPAEGDRIVLLRGDPLRDLGRFELDANSLLFKHGGTSARLQPRPPLVGEQTIEALYDHNPRYRTLADGYQPDPKLLAKLKEVQGDYRVRVIFGSWCGVCKQFMPRGLKVQEELAGSAIQFVYFGLPIEDAWKQDEVKRLGVKQLPTAIVYEADRELGRYAGANGWQQPEQQLWAAISRASSHGD